MIGSKCRAEPMGKEGVHQQRVVSDFGGVKSTDLSPRAKLEGINKEWSQILVWSKCRAEPAGKEGGHQQGVVSDFGRVKSADLSPRAKWE